VPACFFDSSAIVKRYVNEIGTAWVAGLTDPTSGNRIYVASITGVEVVSAITRRQRGGSLSATDAITVLTRFRHDLAHEYRVVEISPALVAAAMMFAEAHALRAYDAVQLATAVAINCQGLLLRMPLTLISADAALNAAARSEGLAVDDPNSHP
jgi:predicted nucleic acid-binding protein